jgi:hypothetical protein
MRAERRYITAALAVVLTLALGWNIYQAEVESRPPNTPGTTISGDYGVAPASSPEKSPWPLPSQTPSDNSTP